MYGPPNPAPFGVGVLAGGGRVTRRTHSPAAAKLAAFASHAPGSGFMFAPIFPGRRPATVLPVYLSRSALNCGREGWINAGHCLRAMLQRELEDDFSIIEARFH